MRTPATIERCITRPTQWRGPATRDEQRAVTIPAMVVIAAIALWLASYSGRQPVERFSREEATGIANALDIRPAAYYS